MNTEWKSKSTYQARVSPVDQRIFLLIDVPSDRNQKALLLCLLHRFRLLQTLNMHVPILFCNHMYFKESSTKVLGA